MKLVIKKIDLVLISLLIFSTVMILDSLVKLRKQKYVFI